jgi:hypothetical protein
LFLRANDPLVKWNRNREKQQQTSQYIQNATKLLSKDRHYRREGGKAEDILRD